MAEMTWTTLVIGGPVPQNKMGEFRELCDEYFGGFGAFDDPNYLIDCALRDGDRVTLAGSLNFGNVGPLAITIEGGAVQDAVSDDTRLYGIDVLVVDYDIDGAEVTYNVTQRDHRGKVDGVSEAVVSDRAVCPASGIDLVELWHNFTHAEDGLDEADA